ncbi:MAG: replicative DNA helicase [Myxococcales bacterium]|nr:replicative DNA helicase [Myxococcales bacterium]MCB9532277.1 replicative DNA helicase [Myxococcales bacterium]
MSDSGADVRRAVAAQPHDPDAERAVLGAVLLDPGIMKSIGNTLAVEDFYLESHRCIYRAVLELDDAQEAIDGVLVVKKLRELELLEPAGGAAYVAQLSALVPTVANANHYATIVKEKSTLRGVIAFATEAAHIARTEVDDVSGFVDELAQKASALANTGGVSSVVSLKEALRPALDLAERLSEAHKSGRRDVVGVPSGFHALDKITAGWQPSDLIILAARPGMGKTAFALNMLVNAAKDRRGATAGVIFSLEMSREQLATRLWCAESMVPMEAVRTGDLPPARWEKLYNGFSTLRELRLYVDDTAAIPVSEMMRKCRQLKQERDIGIVVVDYLQLMTASSTSKNTSREQQISEISRNLKQLAKELHVPVIALSQLNRGVESRTDKRPLLSDLRESGAIEQDADIIVFLYRDDYYQQMKGNEPGAVAAPGAALPGAPPSGRRSDAASVTEVIIAKHRSGSTGKVDVQFHAPYTLFSNLPHDLPPPPGDADRPPGL